MKNETTNNQPAYNNFSSLVASLVFPVVAVLLVGNHRHNSVFDQADSKLFHRIADAIQCC